MLREKLQKAEEGKQDAVRKMEAARVKSEIAQRQMAELGQKYADVSLYHQYAPLKIIMHNYFQR